MGDYSTTKLARWLAEPPESSHLRANARATARSMAILGQPPEGGSPLKQKAYASIVSAKIDAMRYNAGQAEVDCRKAVSIWEGAFTAESDRINEENIRKNLPQHDESSFKRIGEWREELDG